MLGGLSAPKQRYPYPAFKESLALKPTSEGAEFHFSSLHADEKVRCRRRRRAARGLRRRRHRDAASLAALQSCVAAVMRRVAARRCSAVSPAVVGCIPPPRSPSLCRPLSRLKHPTFAAIPRRALSCICTLHTLVEAMSRPVVVPSCVVPCLTVFCWRALVPAGMDDAGERHPVWLHAV